MKTTFTLLNHKNDQWLNFLYAEDIESPKRHLWLPTEFEIKDPEDFFFLKYQAEMMH